MLTIREAKGIRGDWENLGPVALMTIKRNALNMSGTNKFLVYMDGEIIHHDAEKAELVKYFSGKKLNDVFISHSDNGILFTSN